MGSPLRSKPDSEAFKTATTEVVAVTISGIVLTFLEFVFLGLGWTVMYPRINFFQILLHFCGLLQMVTIVLVGLSYTYLRPVLCFFAGVPVLLEIFVGLGSCYKISVVDYIQERRRIRSERLQKEIAKHYAEIPQDEI